MQQYIVAGMLLVSNVFMNLHGNNAGNYYNNCVHRNCAFLFSGKAEMELCRSINFYNPCCHFCF